MFRPLRLLSRNAVRIVTIHSQRSKVFAAESFLDSAQRLKLWHMENKQLFGPIVREKKLSLKDKRKRATKSSKASPSNTETSITGSTIIQKNEKKISMPITKADLITINKDFLNSQLTKIGLNNANNMSNLSKLHSSKHAEKKYPYEIVSSNIKNGILSASNTGVPSIISRNLRLFPMMSNQKAIIVDSSSDDANEDKILQVRSTQEEHLKFPSVTRILEQTMSPESKEALEKWKKEKIAELGEEGFQVFYKAQLDSGSRFHELLSKHLVTPQDLMPVDKQIKGVWSSVGHILKDIKSPKAVESHVVHPVLKYKGIVDCIALYHNKPTLIEWKKSDKPKQTLSATYDNPVQLAAYFGAISHDPHYKGLNVRDALLVIAYTDGSPADCFHLTTDNMRQHWAAWLTRLEKYWAANEAKKAEASTSANEGKSES